MTDDRSKGLLNNKSFWVRTASGIVMLAVLVTVFVLGYDVLLCFLCALSLVGLFEFYRALKLGWGVFAFIGYGTVIAHYVIIRFLDLKFALLAYGVALILVLAAFVFTYPKYQLQQVFGAYFGIFYTGFSLSFLYLLRIHPPAGAYLVWLIIISSWGCDVFAYLFGMKLGKHQLVPRLSPNKSVEGAAGGVVGAVVLAVIYGICVNVFVGDIKVPYAPLIFAVICLVGAVVSQIGDLAASAIKRLVNIKDYGHLIPGHGGILDRFDSMIIVAPVLYFGLIYSSLMT